MEGSSQKRRLGEIFVSRGLVTHDQLQDALAVQRQGGGKLGEILVALGYTTRIALAGVISEQWDERGVTGRGQRAARTPVAAEPVPERPVENHAAENHAAELAALRTQLEETLAELTMRERQVRNQAETIDALLLLLRDAEPVRPSSAVAS